MPTNPLTHNPVKPGSPPILSFTAPSVVFDQRTFPAIGKRTTRALAEVEKLEAQRARWEAAVVAKTAELEDLKRRIGEDVLAAPDDEQEQLAARISRQIGALEAELDAAVRTQAASAQKVVGAKRSVLRAEAQDLNDQLSALRNQAAEHGAKLRKLLAAVSEHDVADYQPVVPAPLSAGSISMQPAAPYKPSKAVLLAREIAHLELIVEIADAAAAGQPLPMHRGGVPIELSMYSPRVRGPLAYFPELVA